MIVIVSRSTIRTTNKFNWNKFGSRFVLGGLPVGSTSSDVCTAYLHRSFNPRTAHDRPKYRRGPRQWNYKFRYKWAKPIRSLVHMTSPPTILSYIELEAAAAAIKRRIRWRDYLKFNAVVEIVGRTTPLLGDIKWSTFVGDWWHKLETWRGNAEAEEKPFDPDEIIPAFRYIELFRRRRRRKNRYLRRLLRRRYKPRWYISPRRKIQFDLLRSILVWKSNIHQSPLGWRDLIVNSPVGLPHCSDLNQRLRSLQRRQRCAFETNKQTDRYSNHVKYIFSRITQKISSNRRRQIRFRRKKLQSILSQKHNVKDWFHLVTRSFFRQFKISRHPLLEFVKLTTPSQNYAFGLYYRAIRMLNVRVGNVLEYTYLKRNSTYFAFINRKSIRSKRWRLGDHPVQRLPFVESRAQRWNWFKEGALLNVTNNLLHSKKDNKLKDNTLFDPQVPPTEPGFWAITYWNLQEWGRGSRWRTRPINRSLSVFLKSVRSGHSYEHDMEQWSHASTSATGVKHSLLIEDELRLSLSTDNLVEEEPVPKLITPVEVVLPLPPKVSYWVVVRPTVLRVWYGFLSLLTKIVWKVFLVFWFPYSLIAQCFSLLFSILEWGGHFVTTRLVRFWVLLVILLENLDEWLQELWFLLWFKSPWFKTTRWVYITWLLVYSAGDDGEELDIPSVSEDDRENFFSEEEEITGNYGEDDDELGGHPLMDPPRVPWESWWEKEVDSFYDEGLEIAYEIFLDEVPSFFKLCARPFIDFAIKLPLWGFLDGFTALTAAVKLDTQRFWYNLLISGNTVDVNTGATRVVGRWWKWPLVCFRIVIHWGATLLLATFLVGQLSSSSLKLWVVYSVGAPYYEEYYIFWLCLCIGTSIWLIGPSSLKTYLFHEIGLSNLTFLLVGSGSLTFPEEYYPHRPSTPFRNEWAQRAHHHFHKNTHLEFTGEDRDKFLPIGLSYTDEFQLTLAQLRPYNEFVWEWELDDSPSGLNLVVPHLDDFVTFENHYKNDPYRYDVSLEKRHPSYTRSNFYDIHFLRNDEPFPYYYPSYHYTGQLRNNRVSYSGNQSEIAGNFSTEQP
jgi:hypothetical protein